ncbi:hypothetical protein OUZ56_020843 [Daphnia magna]|uniref:Uncharacterized protein n=1 Tax=Daphnia magna TaxID=35525 RepID=A0ABQ9ZFM1_9CRUS|nr:hypothetical protein OUZ56_020843 [Daphnia magna]
MSPLVMMASLLHVTYKVVRRLLKRNFFLWGEFTKIGCHHVMGNHFLTVNFAADLRVNPPLHMHAVSLNKESIMLFAISRSCYMLKVFGAISK